VAAAPASRGFGFGGGITAPQATDAPSYRTFDAKHITDEQKAIMEQQMRAEK